MDKRIEQKLLKLSIIIPVYNTEGYFQRCMESVLKQSYSNLEIIVVNDGSKGNIRGMIEHYKNTDSRVKYIEHTVNKGLYRARISGVHAATGDYITFVDSDDYMTSDYYHRLLASAVQHDSDIVIGKTVWEDQGEKYIYNFHEANFMFDVLEGEAVQKAYFGQAGNCYSWHTVWNKIYRKELWDKAIKFFDTIDDHIIMTEDILFSSVLFYYAKRISAVENDAYFYCANEAASTNAAKMTMERFRKNMHDISMVFQSVDNFLDKEYADKWIKAQFYKTRKLYARMWRKLPENEFSGQDLKEAREICNQFCSEDQKWECPEDQFFSTLRTSWQGGLEYFKDVIISGKFEYISFDIFDTVLKRPFLNPEDLFQLMDKKFEALCSANVSFSKLRKSGEQIARKKWQSAERQDVTLSEIYACIAENYGLEKEIVSAMMQEEINLECKFCGVRNAGRELYELARLMGRKIIFTSDMYLEEDTIKKLLHINQFCEYKNVYVSSKVKKLKYNGDLFRYMMEQEGITAQQVIHIGDTWRSDIEGAQKAGIETIFFPKGKDIFQNAIQGSVTNQCSKLAYQVCNPIQKTEQFGENIGYSTMLGMIANRYFDNPYRAFHGNSDLNGDPYFIGYYLLGMHMVGLVKWIISECEAFDYKKVLFMSRDGYLPMLAYKCFMEKKNLPACDYMYVSRKAVMPGMICEVQDLFDLPIECRNHSPKTLLKLLEFCSKKVREDELCKLVKKEGFQWERKFQEQEEYHTFIRFFIKNIYSEEKLIESQNLAKEYYGKIEKDSVAFDMGYSGKIQKAVSKLCGHPVDVLFVHNDLDSSYKMKRKGQFRMHTYYDYVPQVPGLLREHMLSEMGGGCLGFEKQGKSVKPVFDIEERGYADKFVIGCMHQGALDFVRDYLNYFAEYDQYVETRYSDLSAPFEAYLKNSKDVDRWLFKGAYFEDSVYGGNAAINVYEFLKQQVIVELSNQNEGAIKEKGNERMSAASTYDILVSILNNKNKIVRAIVFCLIDKELFINKLKKNAHKLWNKLKNSGGY